MKDKKLSFFMNDPDCMEVHNGRNVFDATAMDDGLFISIDNDGSLDHAGFFVPKKSIKTFMLALNIVAERIS